MKIRLDSGQVVYTGCNLPSKRPISFEAFAAALPMLTREQILDVIQDGDRVPRRKLFDKTWIPNQGNYSSCNGWAAARALERAHALRGMQRVPLSGESLYAQINGDRDQGSMLDAGMKALMKTGVAPESLVTPGTIYWRNITQAARDACSRFRGFECYRVDGPDELSSGIAQGWVGVVAVHAGSRFVVGQDGIVGASSGPGNHAVLVDDLVEVGGDIGYDMANSWGQTWGTGGRGILTWRKHLAEPARNHAFYLIRSTWDDPEGDNPPELQT